MAGIVESLFGVNLNPDLLQQQIRNEQEQRAFKLAQMGNSGPFAGASYGALVSGERLRESAMGAMGQEDPRVSQQRKLASVLATTQQQADLATPDGLIKLAENLNQFPEFSNIAILTRQEAAKLAQQQKQQGLEQQLTEAKIGTEGFRQTKLAAETEKVLREPAAKTETVVLPPGAVLVDKTTGNIVATGSQQGGSKIKTVDLGDRVEYYQEGSTAPFKTERKGETPSTSFRRELQDLKQEENLTKQQQALQGASDNALRVLNQVKEAKDLVGDYTTGAIGGALAVLPQTDARKFANRIKTIKANLGFDRLQQMRDASPTGGALGQVAVQEIEFLQSTIATLDQLESKEDIIKALVDIEKSYQRWLDAVKGRMSPQEQPPAAGGAPVIRRFGRDAQGNIVPQ